MGSLILETRIVYHTVGVYLVLNYALLSNRTNVLVSVATENVLIVNDLYFPVKNSNIQNSLYHYNYKFWLYRLNLMFLNSMLAFFHCLNLL